MGDGEGGKRWLSEKVVVFGGEIEVGGGVKRNKIKKRGRWEWMDIEKEGGMWVRSWVMELEYEDYKMNMVDSGGEEEFGEDS